VGNTHDFGSQRRFAWLKIDVGRDAMGERLEGQHIAIGKVAGPWGKNLDYPEYSFPVLYRGEMNRPNASQACYGGILVERWATRT
jgi:hypothetical protein